MTEPFLSGKDLHPIVELVFRRRYKILTVFLLFTVGTYGTLKVLKVAKFAATSLVMVKIPLVDFDFRVDPNPQASSVYLALAESDGLLADTYRTTRQLREALEPLAVEFEIPDFIPADQREGYLAVLRRNSDFRSRLKELADTFPEEWKQDLIADPMMAIGLLEISQEDISGLPLHRLQESFKVQSKIALQTNITIVNEPFLNFKVTWDSPGASAVLANVWGRLFVDRANALTIESGSVTEDSMMSESEKMQDEAEALRLRIAEMESTPDYQDMKRAESIERLLFGSKNTFRMHGYVELEGEMVNEPGLIVDHERMKATQPDQATRTAEAEIRISELSKELQNLRRGTAEFVSRYQEAKASLMGIERIFADRLTTSLFTHSRIKGGYYNPPMVFVEKAVPGKRPTGPSKSILSLAVGAMVTLMYLCWILYAGYLVPSLRSSSSLSD